MADWGCRDVSKKEPGGQDFRRKVIHKFAAASLTAKISVACERGVANLRPIEPLMLP
jgi:hypothetical protein